MNAMLPTLQKAPVGLRTVARVPRNLATTCDLLRSEMPNFCAVIDWLQMRLELQLEGDKSVSLTPILLGGAPGVGKTYFSLRFAELMRLQCEVITMETTSASWVISGGDLGWSGGCPGIVYRTLVDGQQANPMIVLDELDKSTSDSKYPASSALYALLEPATARAFRDEACREVPLDARGINWVATANDVTKIPEPLLNRMKVFDVPLPSTSQRATIAHGVYRDLRRANHWGKRFSERLPEASARLIATREGSVRTMRTHLEMAFAHALRRGLSTVEPPDVRAALSGDLTSVDLERLEVRGRA